MEERYMVFKMADVQGLHPKAQAQLRRLLSATTFVREIRGAEPLKAVVVEHDWPEYKGVVRSILRRAEGGFRWRDAVMRGLAFAFASYGALRIVEGFWP